MYGVCVTVIEIILNKTYIGYKECLTPPNSTLKEHSRQNSGKVGSFTCFCPQNSKPTPWCSQDKTTLLYVTTLKNLLAVGLVQFGKFSSIFLCKIQGN